MSPILPRNDAGAFRPGACGDMPASAAAAGSGSSPGDTTAPLVHITYWAAARSITGTTTEDISARNGTELLEALRRCYGSRFAALLDRSVLLVNGVQVPSRSVASLELAAGDTVEVLPPFAGG